MTKRRLVDYEATKGQKKCQYCCTNLADKMFLTRNGRRWKCDKCIDGAAKFYELRQIKANA